LSLAEGEDVFTIVEAGDVRLQPIASHRLESPALRIGVAYVWLELDGDTLGGDHSA
jgi:hypothetical protein